MVSELETQVRDAKPWLCSGRYAGLGVWNGIRPGPDSGARTSSMVAELETPVRDAKPWLCSGRYAGLGVWDGIRPGPDPCAREPCQHTSIIAQRKRNANPSITAIFEQDADTSTPVDLKCYAFSGFFGRDRGV